MALIGVAFYSDLLEHTETGRGATSSGAGEAGQARPLSEQRLNATAVQDRSATAPDDSLAHHDERSDLRIPVADDADGSTPGGARSSTAMDPDDPIDPAAGSADVISIGPPLDPDGPIEPFGGSQETIDIGEPLDPDDPIEQRNTYPVGPDLGRESDPDDPIEQMSATQVPVRVGQTMDPDVL